MADRALPEWFGGACREVLERVRAVWFVLGTLLGPIGMAAMIIVPASAPVLLAGSTPLERPSDLAKFTLLHENPDRHDWLAWLDTFDVRGVDPRKGNADTGIGTPVRPGD